MHFESFILSFFEKNLIFAKHLPQQPKYLNKIYDTESHHDGNHFDSDIHFDPEAYEAILFFIDKYRPALLQDLILKGIIEMRENHNVQTNLSDYLNILTSVIQKTRRTRIVEGEFQLDSTGSKYKYVVEFPKSERKDNITLVYDKEASLKIEKQISKEYSAYVFSLVCEAIYSSDKGQEVIALNDNKEYFTSLYHDLIRVVIITSKEKEDFPNLVDIIHYMLL